MNIQKYYQVIDEAKKVIQNRKEILAKERKQNLAILSNAQDNFLKKFLEYEIESDYYSKNYSMNDEPDIEESLRGGQYL